MLVLVLVLVQADAMSEFQEEMRSRLKELEVANTTRLIKSMDNKSETLAAIAANKKETLAAIAAIGAKGAGAEPV